MHVLLKWYFALGIFTFAAFTFRLFRDENGRDLSVAPLWFWLLEYIAIFILMLAAWPLILLNEIAVQIQVKRRKSRY